MSGSTLSNPPLMSRQREETLRAGRCRVRTVLTRAEACIERGERGERATLVGVEETHIAGHHRESGSGNSVKDFGDCLEEDNDSERGWGVVRGFTGFV